MLSSYPDSQSLEILKDVKSGNWFGFVNIKIPMAVKGIQHSKLGNKVKVW